MGREDLLEREEFKGEQNRSKNRVALNAEINKALAARNTAEWIEILTRGEVPCGPIYAIDQVFADPQVKHIGAAAEVDHPKLGRYKLIAQAAKLSRTPASVKTPTPELGQHTDEILTELGLSKTEIVSLRERGVI